MMLILLILRFLANVITLKEAWIWIPLVLGNLSAIAFYFYTAPLPANKKEVTFISRDKADTFILRRLEENGILAKKAYGKYFFESEGYYGKAEGNVRSEIYQAHYIDAKRGLLYWAAIRQDNGKIAFVADPLSHIDQVQERLKTLTDQPIYSAVMTRTVTDAMGNTRIETTEQPLWQQKEDIPKTVPDLIE